MLSAQPLPLMSNPFGFQFYPGRRLPAVCRDGVTRSAVITGQADTWFSIPAAVQVTAGGKRRTVAGYLTHDNAGTVCFRAYLYRANHVFIPLTGHKPRLAKLARKLIAAVKCVNGDYSPAVMAEVCRTEAAGLTEPPGQSESPGWIACRLLRRLPCHDLKRLAAYFNRLGRFQSAAGE